MGHGMSYSNFRSYSCERTLTTLGFAAASSITPVGSPELRNGVESARKRGQESEREVRSGALSLRRRRRRGREGGKEGERERERERQRGREGSRQWCGRQDLLDLASTMGNNGNTRRASHAV